MGLTNYRVDTQPTTAVGPVANSVQPTIRAVWTQTESDSVLQRRIRYPTRTQPMCWARKMQHH